MRLGLFRASPRRLGVARLHSEIVAAARQPEFYLAYGVADSFEGRFEMVALLAGLVLRQLAASPAPGPELSVELSDALFAHFDHALRETGFGDTSVPKQMKRLTEAYLGRNMAYETALRGPDGALEAALARNVLSEGADAARLARYVRASLAALAPLDARQLLNEPTPWPKASEIA